VDAFLIVVAILVVWLYLRKSGTIAYDIREDSIPWYISKGIKPSSVRHFIYEDPVLVKNPGAVIVVGIAEKEDGDVAGLADVGFVIEVIPGQGVVEGVVLQPYGTATHHKLESQYAKMHGMTLIDRLQQKNKAAQEQNKKAGHTEAKYIGDQESKKSVRKKPDTKSSAAHRLQKILDEPEPIESKSHNNKEGDYELFYGGDGLSESTPVSIHSTSMEAVKPLMDKFIIDNCGNDCERTGDEYTIGYQEGSQKIIKVIQVQKSDKSKMKFFFDMSYQLDNFKDMINLFGDIPWGREVVDYQAGEEILVIDGPFNEFDGVIEEVDYENNLLKVGVSIFGRYTSAELGFSQVRRMSAVNTETDKNQERKLD
jgi:transcription antitermination factor NusG